MSIARSLGLTLAQFDALPGSERDYWVADWQITRETCPDCGNPLSECSDPDRLWYPYRRICYATMNREGAVEAYGELHGEDAAYHDGTFTNWAKKRSAEYPYAAMAGVSIGVAQRDLAPHDKFTTQVDASPVESPDSSTSTGQGAEAVER